MDILKIRSYTKRIIILFVLLIMANMSLGQNRQNESSGENPLQSMVRHDVAGGYKKILMINSYHIGYQWTDILIKNVKENLHNSNFKVELFIENLDSKRFGTQEQWNNKVRNAVSHFPEGYIDAILATDDNALQSIVNIMDNKLSEIPVIFCGVCDFNPEKYKQYKNITGVVQTADCEKTVKLALELFPKTRNIAVITDDTTTGKAYKEQLEKALRSNKENLIFLDGSKIYYQKLLERLSELPSDTIALMGIWQKDCFGDYYQMENAYPEISETCDSPIFGISDFGIGYGIVGGYVSSAETQADIMSQYVIDIFSAPDSILPEVNTTGLLDLKFDYKQMKRWRIKRSDVPKDSIFVNEPNPLSTKTLAAMWAGSISLILLGILTASLITYFLRYKRISEAHNEHYKQTSLLWDNIPMWCGAINAKGDFLLTNETKLNHLSKVANKWPKHSADIIETINRCIEDQKRQELTFPNYEKILLGTCNPVPYDFFGQDAVVWVTKDVTEQEKIKQEIIQNNYILNNALKAVQSCHWVWLPTSNQMLIDEHFWLCQGVNPKNDKKEYNISFFWKNINPLDEEPVKESLTELTQGKIESCKCECRISHSGKELWFLVRANILSKDSNGKPDQISVFMTKIDSSKRIELDLKEKKKQLSVAQKMANVGYWTSDPATDTITASHEMFRIMNVPVTIDGKCQRSIFRDKIVEIEKWSSQLEKLNIPGESFETTVHIRINGQDDGEYRTVWTKVTLNVDEMNNNIYLGVSQDITEHVNMQNELRNREKYLLQAASLARMFYWHYDVNTKNFIFTNTSAVWGENNIDGIQSVYSIIDRIHPEDRKGCSAALQRAMTGQEPKGSFTYRSMHNGVIKYITTMWEAFFESDGTLESMIGISMDVSEAKEREKLEISKMEAEAMAKTKSRFLATMSHEIRTPINVIIGMSHLLRDTELDDIQNNFAGKIDHAAKSLLAIVNDVLDISKIEENKLTIENIDFSLNEIAFNNASTMAIGAEKKDVEIHVVIDKSLPARLYGDPLRLSQILTNYISNAVKFTDQGDITLSIRPLDKNDNTIIIEFAIKDSGIGIAQENLEKLFDAYTQAEKSTTRKFGGTGLGLAICKQLAELMGGSIRAESELGKGSTFFVTLPFEIPEDAGEQSTYKIPELKGKKAIIIDDNTTSQAVIKELISTAGFDTTTVSSGKDGIRAIEESETKFDLAIIDWAMPEMNGIQTAREIMQRFPDKCPKLIAVTAHNHENVMHQCLNAGYAGFIAKPIVPSEMINTIRKAFNLSVLIQREEKEDRIIPDLTSKRILVVEDQELNQEILINVLNKTNAHIEVADNGEEALIKVEADKYDLILMDIQMPVMNGLEATEEIRKLEGREIDQLPILAMSANAMSEDVENSQKAGMNDHITKPIIPDLLYKKLAEHISMTSNTAELSSLMHIDANKGISHTDGNQELYLKMLKDFAIQCPQQSRELNAAVQEGKNSHASEVAHIIKGIAGNIGANELMNLAAKLEESLENSSEDIEQICKKMNNEVTELIDEIHAAFENKTSDTPTENIKNI